METLLLSKNGPCDSAVAALGSEFVWFIDDLCWTLPVCEIGNGQQRFGFKGRYYFSYQSRDLYEEAEPNLVTMDRNLLVQGDMFFVAAEQVLLLKALRAAVESFGGTLTITDEKFKEEEPDFGFDTGVEIDSAELASKVAELVDATALRHELYGS